MPQQSFQDMVPPERRSIRNIAPSHTRARPQRMSEETFETPPPATPPPKRRPFALPRRFGGIFAVIAALVLATIGFSLLLSGSKVVVKPKQKDVAIESSFEAVKDAEGSAPLGYQVMAYSQSASKTVAAGGEEHVEEKASGTIIIFNNYGTAPQRLIKNTRFETSEGLIYRISESVVVPGQVTKGGETLPGSIEAVVYADEAGEKYNIGLSDFTIPGFKGDPRYGKFYARSKTAMTGGFSGTRPSVDPDELSKTTAELKSELEKRLRADVLAQLPEGFHLFSELQFVAFDPVALNSKGREVEVLQQATLYGILFRKSELAEFVAQQTVAGYDDEPVGISDMSTLSLTLAAATENPWQADRLALSVTGTAHLIWQFSEEGLREDLAGRSKDALPTVLSGYPGIEEARVLLRPFWKRSFPDDASDIRVEVDLGE